MNLRLATTLAACGALACLVACGACVASDGEVLSTPLKELAACGATNAPKLRAASPAEYPESLWNARESWRTSVSFRLDEAGNPYWIHASLTGFGPHASSSDLVRATEDALSRYRFCLPADFSTKVAWTVSMRFAHVAFTGQRAGEEMYMQILIPRYTRADAAAKRAGVTIVRGVFGADGRPISVGVVTGSGDEILDAKSLEGVASSQLTYRRGDAMKFPLTFDQPYHY